MAEILKRFFFDVDLDKKMYSVKRELRKNVSLGTTPNESPKFKEISNQNSYKFLKLENIRIISKQPTKKANHYRVNYLDKWQNSGFFFMDGYFRDKKEVIQPNLVSDFLLLKGYKYQFFSKFV